MHWTPEKADAPTLIELRLAYDEPAPGRTSVEHDGLTHYLDSNALVSDADFLRVTLDSARATSGEGSLLLHLELHQSAAARVHTATSNAIGARIALILNSALRSTVVIHGPLAGPALQAHVNISAAEIDAIVERWPQRSPPLP